MLHIVVWNGADDTTSVFDTDLDGFKQWLSEFPLTVNHVIHISEVRSDDTQ